MSTIRKARLRLDTSGCIVAALGLQHFFGHTRWGMFVVGPLLLLMSALTTWMVLLDPPWRDDPRFFAKLNQGFQVVLLLATLWCASEILSLETHHVIGFLLSLGGSALLCAGVATFIGRRERARFGRPDNWPIEGSQDHSNALPRP